MKKQFITVLAMGMALSLSACNSGNTTETPAVTDAPTDAVEDSGEETLVGQAQGYGGTVTVTITKDGDKIAKVEVDGPDETDGIGTNAIDQLPALIEAANGIDGVDAISGATVTSEAIFTAFSNAINDVDGDSEEEAAVFAVPTFTNEPVGEVGEGLRIGQMEYAAHGANSFALTTVVLDGDVIAAAYIDEYQFMAAESNTGVPNSDESFGEKYANPERVLGSKRVNNETYSANMAEKGGATVEIAANFDFIQEYVVGKTIAELEDLIYNNSDEEVLDAVSSATLTDTSGYIKSVVEAARVAAANEAVDFDGDVASLKFGRSQTAAHGTNCFLVASALVDGDTVILSYLDEYQPMSGDVIGVPNTDAGFGEGFADVALVSKRCNNETYSANMAEKADATVEIAANYDSIQNYANGKTVAEISETADMEADDAVDAVSGATLVDTNNYLAGIVAAAEAAK